LDKKITHMQKKEFEFKAFIFRKYYQAVLVFLTGSFLIIGLPWFITTELLFTSLGKVSLFPTLIIYTIIITPFTWVFFKLLFHFFYLKTYALVGDKILIKRGHKTILELDSKKITQTIIRKNDDTSLKNRYRTIELIWSKKKRLKIVSRDKNQEGVFNDFIESYLSFFDIDSNSLSKQLINKQGDYKLIYNH